MSLYAYSVFITVAEQQSFAKAAALLHLTPSAVSHTIAKLEEDFGFPLFLRGRKSTVLTDGGKQILTYVKEISATSEMMELCVNHLRNASSGVVRFGFIDSFGVRWLPEILTRYRLRHPDVEVQVQESGYQTLIEKVTAQKLDLAIVSHSSVRKLAVPLQFIPIYQDRIVCVSRKTAVPSHHGFLSAQALSEMNLVLPHLGDETDITAYLQEQGTEIRCTCFAATNSSLITMVRCGFGHGIVPELSLAGHNCDDLAVLPIVPVGFRTLGIITHDPKFLTPAARAFCQCIQEFLSVDTPQLSAASAR